MNEHDEDLKLRVEQLKKEKFDLLSQIEQLKMSNANLRKISVSAFSEANYWEMKYDEYKKMLDLLCMTVIEAEPEEDWNEDVRKALRDIQDEIMELKLTLSERPGGRN